MCGHLINSCITHFRRRLYFWDRKGISSFLLSDTHALFGPFSSKSSKLLCFVLNGICNILPGRLSCIICSPYLYFNDAYIFCINVAGHWYSFFYWILALTIQNLFSAWQIVSCVFCRSLSSLTCIFSNLQGLFLTRVGKSDVLFHQNFHFSFLLRIFNRHDSLKYNSKVFCKWWPWH